jgi:DNA polymerase-3 subunit alpha
MQPDNFEDISAALALYRPGPMGVNAHTNFALRKNGKQELIPLDPQLEGKLQPRWCPRSSRSSARPTAW